MPTQATVDALTLSVTAMSGRIPMGGRPLAMYVNTRGEGVALVHLPDNEVTPYVTWSFTSGLDGFCHGQYRVELKDARGDLFRRAEMRQD